MLLISIVTAGVLGSMLAGAMIKMNNRARMS